MAPRMLVLVALSCIVMSVPGTKGGLLEESDVNSIDKGPTAVTFTSPCLTSDRAGVVPCDTNPACCVKDAPRIPGTNYCCPRGATQYNFLNMNSFICACTI